MRVIFDPILGALRTSDASNTAGMITGSGTLNYYAKWTPNGASIGNSLTQDDGTTVSIGTGLSWNNSTKILAVSGGQTIAGTSSTPATNSLSIINSSATLLMRVRDDGVTFFNNTNSYWSDGFIQLYGSLGANSPLLSLVNYSANSSVFEFRQAGNSALLYMKDSSNTITNLLHSSGSSYFNGGNFGIGTTTPNTVALLDVQSTTKGVRFPNMTTTQRDAISSPPAGLVIYNTTTSKMNVFTTTWETITSV